jgi:GWxTD domain-containing protein
MTKAEHEQWAAIKTDEEAEQFVNRFLASRGPGFADEVATRAANADKYLTIDKTMPGSRTLRGKIVILFGPPTGFNVVKRTEKGNASSTTGSYMAAGGDGTKSGGQGASVTDMIDASNRRGLSGREIHDYTISYAGDKLPRPRAEPLSVTVSVDTSNGKESLADRPQASELEELFQTAAAVSATPAKPAQ